MARLRSSLIRRRWLVAGTLLAAPAVLVGTFAGAQAPLYARIPARIAIAATPIVSFDNREPERIRFGQLEFRGGLALTSSYKPFGGVSGLHMAADGAHFLGVTDKGSWLRGRIVYRGGRPVRIADAEMAPILGRDGKPLAARGWYDAESLTERDGKVHVGFERVHGIVRFDIRRHGLAAHAAPIAVPADFRTFTKNKSIECLAEPPKGSSLAGALIVVTEHSLDAAGNLRGYVLQGSRATRFAVKRSDDFDISDCAVLPPAGLLLLERRYSLAAGVAIRIRRVALAAIKPGAVVDGSSLLEADLAYQIDNMEGMALHRNANGETIITLVSDDNFSPLQRTLLLQFALVGD